MASPLFNFSGLASGLDTNSIVESLIQVERAPIDRLQARRVEYNQKLDAWTSINTKISEFRTSIDAVSSESDFDDFVGVSSSDEDSVAVTLTGSPSPASVSLSVIQLAATHQISTGSGFATTADLVGTGTFSVTTAAGQSDFTTGSTTTLLELAQQINAGDIDVNASIIEVTETDHRILLTSSTSGATGSFTTSSDLTGFATSDEISAGADATIRIGDPVTGLDVTRSTNTFTNVIDGVTIEAGAVTAAPITVGVARDTEAAATAIKAMVESVNGVLAEIAFRTAYNEETDTPSSLTSDSTARDIVSDLQSTLSNTILSTGNIRHLGDLGVEFTREGNYSIDETKLQEALDNDFDDVVGLFARTGSIADSRVTYLNGTGETVEGSYEVIIDTAADVPSVVGSAYVASGAFEDFTLQFRSESGVIGIAAGSTLTQAVTQINDGLALLGIDEVLAEESGGAIKLSAPGFYGATYDLTVTNDTAFGLNAAVSGVDVAGTIGGQTAVGIGRTLTANAGDPTGLAAIITASVADVGGGGLSLGNLTFVQGLSGNIDGWLDTIEGADGEITRARDEWDSRIENVDESIERMELRIILREQQLRREFTAMETALGQLQNQGSFLAGFITPQTGG